jgi:hypothetical protein
MDYMELRDGFEPGDAAEDGTRPGTKDDGHKPRWHLLPYDALEQVVRVMERGAEKYGEDNWKRVPNKQDRYWDAMMRHMTAYNNGQELDPEFGTHHMAHAACCALFVLWADMMHEVSDNGSRG